MRWHWLWLSCPQGIATGIPPPRCVRTSEAPLPPHPRTHLRGAPSILLGRLEAVPRKSSQALVLLKQVAQRGRSLLRVICPCCPCQRARRGRCALLVAGLCWGGEWGLGVAGRRRRLEGAGGALPPPSAHQRTRIPAIRPLSCAASPPPPSPVITSTRSSSTTSMQPSSTSAVAWCSCPAALCGLKSALRSSGGEGAAAHSCSSPWSRAWDHNPRTS